MNINTLSEKFANAPIESIVLDDGREIKAKKISRQAVSTMEAFIPGIRDLSTGLSMSLPIIETLGKTKLFVASGDISKYMKSSNGAFLSSIKDESGKIVGQPGFLETDLSTNGTKAAMSIGKCLPYVQIAIAVIEIGVNIYKCRENIKAEQQKFFDERVDELSDYYDILWGAMDDYTTMVSDDATRSAYMNKIIDAINSANKKFKEMKSLANDPSKTNFRTIEVMKLALLVYSFAYMLKIMYSKTECKNYVDNAITDITQRTAEMNCILESKYSHDKAKIDSQINKSNKFSGMIAAFSKNKAVEIGAAILSGGASFAAEKAAEKATNSRSNQLEKKSAYADEMRDKLYVLSNPYAECIENLGQIMSDKNLILMDEDYLYYEIPEACSAINT